MMNIRNLQKYYRIINNRVNQILKLEKGTIIFSPQEMQQQIYSARCVIQYDTIIPVKVKI